MSIIRIVHNKENPYVQINKQALWNERLSLKAVGLWARCLSRPDDWRFNIKELTTKCKEGRRALDGAINELIDEGYAVRLEHWEKSEDGKFKTGGVEYVFFEFPATELDKQKVLEEFKKSFRHCCFGNSRNGNSRNSNLLKKEETEDRENEEKPSLKVPEEPPPGGGVVGSSPFSEKVKEVGKEMLAIIRKHNSVYREPKDMKKFYAAVEAMIEKDEQDVETLLKTFEWGVGDNIERGDFKGWQGIICSNSKGGKATNPAEIFKKHFAKIHSQMKSRPIRKFDVCHDQEMAEQCFAEMNKRAL